MLGWVAPYARGSLADLVEGVDLALELADGRVIAGTLAKLGARSVIVKAFGRSRAVRLARSSLVTVRMIGPHLHAEWAFVATRQRAGRWLTLQEFARAKPRKERDDESGE